MTPLTASMIALLRALAGASDGGVVDVDGGVVAAAADAGLVAGGAAPDAGAAGAKKAPKQKEVEPWARERWHIVIPADTQASGGQVRIQTPLGRPITLAEGNADVGTDKKVTEAAYQRERLESGLRAYWVERIIVFGTAGIMGLLGLMALAAGSLFVTLLRYRILPPSALRGFTEMPRAGPALIIIGSTTLLVATLGFAIGAAMTAFLVVRPPPPDERILDEIGSSILWDMEDAKAVVKRHHAQPWVQDPPPPEQDVEVVQEGVAPPEPPLAVAPPEEEKAKTKASKTRGKKKSTKGKGK